jgi:hypothetical protein
MRASLLRVQVHRCAEIVDERTCSVVSYLLDSGLADGGCKLHHDIVDLLVSHPGVLTCLQFVSETTASVLSPSFFKKNQKKKYFSSKLFILYLLAFLVLTSDMYGRIQIKRALDLFYAMTRTELHNHHIDRLHRRPSIFLCLTRTKRRGGSHFR